MAREKWLHCKSLLLFKCHICLFFRINVFCKDWKLNCRKSWLGESSFGLSYFQNINLSLLFDLKFLSFKEKDVSGLVHFIKIKMPHSPLCLDQFFKTKIENWNWGKRWLGKSSFSVKVSFFQNATFVSFLNSKVFVKI